MALTERLVVVLTFVSGIVDGIGFLTLGHVFVANMTGNLVLLGLAVATGRLHAALRSLWAFIGFAAGAGAGAVLLRRTPRKIAAVRVMILEAASLLATALLFIPGASASARGVVLLLAGGFAMGLQAALTGAINPVAGTSTVVVTTTLTNLMRDLETGWRRWRRRSTEPTPWMRLRVLVIAAYAIGAAISGLLRPWAPGLLVVAAGITVGVAVLLRRSPSIADPLPSRDV